ncbi:MAG TPA: thiamine-phosphate kinase [Acidobacteriota bacterium]|nr:thiamine-phosphate kinase [Acidobacteriota bacterium]
MFCFANGTIVPDTIWVMRQTIGALGEKKLLRRLSRFLDPGGALVRTYSEDCAVIDAGSEYRLLTVDSFVEGVHFDPAYFPPYNIGRKAMLANVSDISSMGGRPSYALVSWGAPASTPLRFVEEVYRGMRSVSRKVGIRLAGGNVASAPFFFLDIMVEGRVGKKNLLTRAGARKGDILFVTGALGSAALGLNLLRSKIAAKRKSAILRAAINAHFNPPLLNDFASTLGASRLATAMIDLSDGLASDLAELCRESGVGAAVDVNKIPIAVSLKRFFGAPRRKALQLALSGGEDYHLLFTVPHRRVDRFRRFLRQHGWISYEIGVIRESSFGIRLMEDGKTEPLGAGFEHFRK